jgi:hypothetical protein
MKRTDWPEWEKGIYKQLNQYWDQGMFSAPMSLPQNTNALHMLWRYNLKACGTKKCRMVCNGSPRQKGTVTIGHTYANALDAASERLSGLLLQTKISLPSVPMCPMPLLRHLPLKHLYTYT